MNRQDILLKEYEFCQSHNDHIGSQVWVSTTIFLSINVTLLGGLFYTLITKIVLENGGLGETNLIALLAALIGATALGAGIIWILKKWIGWLKRMRFRTSVNFERMGEIEYMLEMRKHTMCRELDQENAAIKPSDLAARKEFEVRTKRFKYFPASGFNGLICIARILGGVWSFSLLVLWVVAIIPLFGC